MITDDELEAMFAAAAAQAPAPQHGVPEPPAPAERTALDLSSVGRRIPKWVPAAAAVLVLLAIGSLALSGGGDDADMSSAPAGIETGDENESLPQATAGGTSGNVLGGKAETTHAQPSADAGVPPAQPDAAKIVKTGSVEVEVGTGGFTDAVSRVTSLATGLGGYVSDSQTTEQGEAPRGTITVRVPVDSFDQLLDDVRRLGTVQSVSSKGTDVTAQFVDIEARIGALQATRDQLLTVLTQAETIPDILAVQDRINAVQVEIDSLTGQQKLLADQSSLATLTVAISEPGAEEPVTVGTDGDGGLAGAWEDAKEGFGNSIEWIVARSGTWAVLAMIGALGYLATRLVLRHYRRAVL